MGVDDGYPIGGADQVFYVGVEERFQVVGRCHEVVLDKCLQSVGEGVKARGEKRIGQLQRPEEAEVREGALGNLTAPALIGLTLHGHGCGDANGGGHGDGRGALAAEAALRRQHVPRRHNRSLGGRRF